MRAFKNVSFMKFTHYRAQCENKIINTDGKPAVSASLARAEFSMTTPLLFVCVLLSVGGTQVVESTETSIMALL